MADIWLIAGIVALGIVWWLVKYEGPSMTEDIDKRTEQYIAIRDMLKRLEEKHDAERKPLLELQEVLSGRIRAFLEANNLENAKTPHGTVHYTTRYTASLADPDAFMRYVVDNQKFELLDRRANATAVKAFVKETSQLPPGCNLNAIQSVGVRRKTGT